MTVKEKLRRYLQNRKTPVTAKQICERMGCSVDAARGAMNALIKEGVAKEVVVAVEGRYVKGVRL